jgi:uncharacterized membrane protein
MIVEHYTRRWHRAGLIDEAAVGRIHAWEAAHKKPIWLWAVAGMGALAIGLGIMAVVGANWEDIPAWFKLALDLVLTMLCAAATFVFWKRNQTWSREISALLLFAVVLASIALIGQIYQLQSDAWRALVLWLALCTPFLALLTTTRLVAAIWAAAALTTWFVASDPLVAGFAALGIAPERRTYWLDSYVVLNLMTYLAALLTIIVGALRRLWPPAERQGGFLLQLGFVGLVAAVSLTIVAGPLAYRQGSELRALLLALVMTAATAGVLMIGNDRRQRSESLTWLALSFVAWAIALWPQGETWLNSSLARAILFIGYWTAIGWLAARAGRRGIFALAFTMVALRLLVLYFEALGGLTATGLGLIGGGVLCLALAAAGWRLTRGVVRRPVGAAP